MNIKKRRNFLFDNDEQQNKQDQKNSDNDFFNPKENEDTIRYRCEQINATHTDQKVIFHANIKKEYLVKFLNRTNPIKIKSVLEDYVYNTEPKHYEVAMNAFKDLEFLKENALFELNTKSEINRILNLETIQKAWIKFRDNILPEEEFYTELKKVNKQAAQDIIDSGNLEFNKEENLIKTFDKNLFYHLLFESYLTGQKETEKNKKISFMSQIFQNVKIELDIKETIVSEDDDFIHKRKVGTLITDNLDVNELIKQYDYFYKPMVKYNFTEYNYIYRMSYKVDKKSGIITEGKAVLSEQIKNNYEFNVQFNLKKVNL